MKNNYNIIEIFNNEKIDIFHSENKRYVFSIVEYTLNKTKAIDVNRYLNSEIQNEIILKEKELKQNIESAIPHRIKYFDKRSRI